MSEVLGHQEAEELNSGRAFDPAYPVWAVAGVVLFAAVMAGVYRPSTDAPADVLLAVVPWVTVAAMTLVFLEQSIPLPAVVKALLIVVVLSGWTVLVYDDSFWSVTGFAVFAMCFVAYADDGIRTGVALAAVAAVAWASAYLTSDESNWLVVLPLIAFVSGVALTMQITATEVRNAQQAELIDQLHQAQRDLAVSERSKGALEERARMAGEIHDTLAQGLTSIVIVSRAGQRSAAPEKALATIEETAQQNLDAARRLVGAIGPVELDSASLADALRRHVDSALPPDVATAFHVVGEQRSLPGDVELAVLRAAQEALANVRAHASATRADVTLSYFDDAVAIDISDDGKGFEPGQVNHRGTLTGGQGIDALRRRAHSLAGELTIESEEGRGAVVSLQLPVDGR